VSGKKARIERQRKKAEEALEARVDAALAEELGDLTRRMDADEQAASERWAEKDRRARYGKLPKPPEEGDVELLYAKLQEDLRHLNDGELVMTVIGTDAWQSTLGGSLPRDSTPPPTRAVPTPRRSARKLCSTNACSASARTPPLALAA
jgi:hypothetical protein